MNRNIVKGFIYTIINNSLLATIIFTGPQVIKNPSVGSLLGLFIISMLWFFSVSVLAVAVSEGIYKIKEDSSKKLNQ